MSLPVRVKICGVTTPDGAGMAADAGAAYVGFVFFAKSPRCVSRARARELALHVPPGVCKVALTVNATDDDLRALTDAVPLDMLQLHGRESPARVAEVRARFGLPVMKAVGIATADDLPALDRYGQVADQLLVDAKPAPAAALPGGNGIAFDWGLIAGRRWTVPWMLAGGLTPDTVAEAIHRTGARQLDVSSGVESAPGMKDPDRIAAFLRSAADGCPA